MGRVFMVASGKGGTGKTMFAVNFAAILAMRGYRTVIVDMDMGQRNVDLYFGLENNVVYDAHDVMTGVCRIRQALIRDERFQKLYMMSASPVREDGTLTPLHAKVLCEKLREQFDYVIIDAPSGVDDGLVIASAGADAAIMVTTPEYASIRNADTVDRELVKMGIREHYLVINNLRVELMQEGYIPSLREINSLMLPEFAGVIQHDENINISTNLGIPIVMKPDTYIRRNFEAIADRILNEPDQKDE
ncbi:septum site-determining protein MinD [Eubacterium pyruvativorans]|uniref:Septum site-determining protein MinD n=1 Tax=Eubacterium pyruvativorans TaxID=155865 RepID=A0A1I7G6I2_9FIRM|nr:septum site-determining protein MinD [Eubacterium pyruvativorans]HAT83032.1 septum site-determining protein MinD [Eubacterium sp.]MCI5746941.1 septum site-determining protein MinD [Eubacterium pyruvativorans]MDD6707946.1 septum site-determining protein MinD [Eubacterium pyruvativorans]MDD7685078.1 septum site-determining protein MinD [Eubacterium pyruvativorans]MDY4048977.1 septum site-determining protein MinD [Eubacterium pyruvativorans]